MNRKQTRQHNFRFTEPVANALIDLADHYRTSNTETLVILILQKHSELIRERRTDERRIEVRPPA